MFYMYIKNNITAKIITKIMSLINNVPNAFHLLILKKFENIKIDSIKTQIKRMILNRCPNMGIIKSQKNNTYGKYEYMNAVKVSLKLFSYNLNNFFINK